MKRLFILTSTIAIAITSACDGSTGPRTGSLTVTINGLPAEVPASVSITTPKKTTLTATATTTLADLEPGTYQIAAYNASNSRSTFAPTNVTATVEVVASKTPAQAGVTYSVTTGVVAVSITGVPAGASPVISLIGPGSPRVVSASGEVGNLAPGEYTVVVNNIDSDELYAGAPNPSSLTVTASTTAVPLSVAYTASTGRVVLSSSGLPPGYVPVWDLIGPAGFSKTVSGTGQVVVTHLPPGQYSALTRNIIVSGETYGSATNPTSFSIAAGQSTPLNIAFVLRPPTLDLLIGAAYLTQSTQNLSGTVPLIAGRDAYLRVFARANESNNAAPAMRARFYRNGALVATHDIAPPGTGVPLGISEANATDSWNAAIPGALIQPGTSILIDVDPANAIKEVDEADNQFPVSGTPKLLDVRTVPPVNIRFVPIMTADGITGDVTQGRLSELVNMTLRIHPLSSIDADLRSAFSSTFVLAKNDTNNVWVKLLGQIDALRVAEGSGRQYVGVLKDLVGSGVAGIAYVPGKAAVVFDENYATETLAHELGHNWSRFHAPCGNPAGVDGSFPYANARIGVYGYDGATSKILPNDMPDLMSYCWLNLSFNILTPRRWTSDYTYMGVLNYRQSFPDVPVQDAARQECLVVWGRVTRRGLVLEPAFTANTIPVLPPRGGKLRLAARDESGATIASFSFDPQRIADAPDAEEHFAYAIPVNQIGMNRLASLSLSASGLAPQTRNAVGVSMTDAQVNVSSPRAGITRFKWNTAAAPLLVISDSRTGEILSLATSGDVSVRTSATSFRVKASNGVRSMEMQLRK